MTKRRHDLPPLDQLEAFEAAARHLSFTRAADELALTQSAVSRQIAAIEQRLGVPLFRRLHRALALTDAGTLLAREVADMLRRLDDVTAQLRRDVRARPLVVTTTPGLAGLWLIPRLARFTARMPQVDVRISAHNRVVDLAREGVDVAIRYSPVGRAGDGAELLFRETVQPVCAPSLVRASRHPLQEPADLRHHVMLHIDTDPSMSQLEWTPWLRAMGVPDLAPAGVLHFSQYDQLVQAALSGQGVALGRSPIIDALLADGRLVAPFAGRLDSTRAYYLVAAPQSAARDEVRAFTAWLREEAGPTLPR